ncbi:MAG: hypothetical protein K8S27_02330 [Candidatus Omnitrophica bacterium]|nr:hypothetical protein [Candidatus Omnitrophota bacterium]
MLKVLSENNKGVVFVTVIMIIMVIMVLAVSIVSVNLNQVIATEEEYKRAQAEILAMGAFRYFHANYVDSASANSLVYLRTIDDVTYTVNSILSASGQLNIVVTY